jgi:hypothetical protein
MPSAQRYVSNELTHFVGRSRDTEQERYDLLLKILREAWLTHPPHKPGPTEFANINLDPHRITADDLCTVDSVCFCDIPLSDLHIHMKKYGRVGLSFSKTFLVAKGANPVFYVAENGPVAVLDQLGIAAEYDEYNADKRAWVQKNGPFDVSRLSARFTNSRGRGEHFYDNAVTYTEVFTAAIPRMRAWELDPSWGRERQARFTGFHDFVAREFYSYLKMFDSSHADEHEKNFYMEREWRVTGNVPFTVEDVERIILPDRSFGRRLRADLPDFFGQVTFVE